MKRPYASLDAIGFADFDDLLDALTIRRKARKRLTKTQRKRMGEKHRATRRRNRVKRDRVARFMAKTVEPASPRRAAAAAGCAAARNAGRDGVAVGRWFAILRAMAPGLWYSAAELMTLVGLPERNTGATVSRDLFGRGYLERIADAKRYEKGRADCNPFWIYRRTEKADGVLRDGPPAVTRRLERLARLAAVEASRWPALSR